MPEIKSSVTLFDKGEPIAMSHVIFRRTKGKWNISQATFPIEHTQPKMLQPLE